MNSTYKNILDSFRQMQQEIQILYMQGQQPSAEMNEKAQKLMTAIQGVPAITKYLQAEERFGILLNDIQRILMEPVEELVGKPDINK
jgi:cell fate (sporulation/competence/biofilm development) regulator YlbF (YheA/YmcA/DUF963 family)